MMQDQEHQPATSVLSGDPPPVLTSADPPNIDALLEPYLASSLTALDGAAPLLARMVRYHLGQIDDRGHPVQPEQRRQSQGKRLRPAIALLCCEAVGGDPASAAPVAAAIELLHNFTLIHDDIQDRSRQRRHRDTVWSIWGEGQAINAGDATFAVAQLALYRLAERGFTAEFILRLSEAFARMTIEIVQGQVLDLGFEGQTDVDPSAYLRMIALKTSAIVRYAAWAGALLGGADVESARRFAEFGLSLGLGFQIRDDLLGFWGAAETTGKPASYDIRRLKQTLPLVMLREAMAVPNRAELAAIYAAPTVTEAGVKRVLALLDQTDVRARVEGEIAHHHQAARAALAAIDHGVNDPAMAALRVLVDSLAVRDA